MAQHRLETHVVGCLARHPDYREETLPLLSEADWTFTPALLVWRAVTALSAANNPVSLVTLAEWLLRHGHLPDVGGVSWLGDMWEGAGADGNPYYTDQLRDSTLLRELGSLGAELAHESVRPTGSALEILERSEGRLFSLCEGRTRGLETHAIASVLPEVLEQIAARQEGRQAAGIPTGIAGLDDILVGLQPGHVVTIGARPSSGKTAMGLQLARHAALTQGVPTFFASMEQSRQELTERLLSAESRVDGQRFRQRRGLTDEDTSHVLCARDRLADAPCYFDDCPAQTMFRVLSTARRLKRRHGVGLVVVDYLQLVQPEDRRQTRYEQVSQVSRRLKQLARELNVPVVALAQLNREVEGRPGGRPRLADLKESGGIEQDSDVVLLIHRLDDPPGCADLIVAKQRNGPVGDVRVRFDRARLTFEEVHVGF